MRIEQHSHIGKRENNEDAFGVAEHVFIVCDGIGGHQKGEVASQAIVNSILENAQNKHFSEEKITDLLNQAQCDLNDLVVQNPLTEGMGTTFAGVFQAKDGYYLAHIGDSRIYYLQPDKKTYWRTDDHSLVGDLLKANHITKQEAERHPRKNEINRAIVANSQGKTVLADILKLKNVQQGDLFFICSDGVNEAFSEQELTTLLMSDLSLQEKKNRIATKAVQLSSDNNTFLLLEIESPDEIKLGDNKIQQTPQVNESLEYDDEQIELEVRDETIEPKNIFKRLIPFLLLAGLILLAVYFYVNQ